MWRVMGQNADSETEWLEKPASPSHIRLIFFGGLLVDTHQLRG
jgi:hypothetical protein